jgi:hypothetical protein
MEATFFVPLAPRKQTQAACSAHKAGDEQEQIDFLQPGASSEKEPASFSRNGSGKFKTRTASS